MPRPRPPHLHREVTRHGKTVWYVRVNKGPRIRLTAAFGTPEFSSQYHDAISGKLKSVAEVKKPGSGTLSWAADLYRQSAPWRALSSATRRQRENILLHVLKANGPAPLGAITKANIVAGRDRRSETPAAARHFIQTMRGLFQWAVNMDLVASDPTEGVAAVRAKTDGHPVWTEDDIAAFETKWPIGTRERVAFDILLYTGLRRGDAVKLGRQHVRDEVARITTEKTGERVAIPICPELRRSLDAGPCGDLTFIAGEKGNPRVKESFGEWFRVTCHAAGIKKSAHGLRKAAATRDANLGYTEAELEAKYGWRGGRMASLYTRSADRERLSLGAANRVRQGKA